jgi:hypothetical protein
MSNFPYNFDDDTTLPFVNDNLTEIGAEAINAVRDAVFNTQQYLGLGGAGTTGSISTRLGISLNPDGTIKSSAIASLGLVTLPIQNNQISSNAEIQESKLKLDHRTSDLYNYIKDLAKDVNTSLGWISASGSKLEPHLLGFAFRHTLSQIDVTNNADLALKNKFREYRDNSDSFALINDINNEFLYHQFADGYEIDTPKLIITNNGTSSYPSNFAHLSSGIFLDTDRFATIPQTANNLQKFADYIDSASIFLLGTRIQNLYSNGISRESRSSSLVADGYGQSLVSVTNVITYLLGTNNSSQPVDNINNGDDIIEFKPSDSDASTNVFDAKFALVKPGDIVRVNYDGVEVSHVIKEKKYAQASGNKKYIVRIDSKNLKYSTTATARIDKPLLNINKYGTLAVAAANNDFSGMPSLIVGAPRGASALGIGFNADLIDSDHCLLYLAIYPTGNPADGYTILPGIDVTGNAGATPGKYTLKYLVENLNNAFRKPGYNYRFIAFENNGEFGIALADSYNNAAFSILSGILSSNGSYDQAATDISFPKNIVGLSLNGSLLPLDALGFGPYKANIASPPYTAAPASAEASQIPTKLFIPLKRNNFYVNGVEIEKLQLDQDQIEDKFGDGYWIATVQSKNVYPGPAPVGRVEITYRIPITLSTSDLAVGKTIVVQPIGSEPLINFGRYTIQSINYNCGASDQVDLTVYDAVHANGISPSDTLSIDSQVAIYFDSTSVAFNAESATDLSSISPFKRHFEVLINQNGKIFTHERARINASASTLNVNGTIPLYTYSELNKLNILKVSSRLRGYQFGIVSKIALKITEFTSAGEFSGYLCSYDGLAESKKGPITTGNIGVPVRFYDDTNTDYIDIIFDTDTVVSAFTDQFIDFQLFPTLSLDNEIMLIATCQLNDVTKKVTHLRDERKFGNISEKELSNSALGFISAGERLLHGNGVIRGFDLEDTGTNPNSNQIYFTGGVVLVNGKFESINQQTVAIPIVQELYNINYYNINWALCINDKSEYQPIPLLDYDLTLNTPNNKNRLFKAYNPVNGQSYVLESTTFSDIINNRKDLTILYIVSSEVTPPSGNNPVSIQLTITDARKYVNDVDNNLALKLTSAKSQGNFKNIESIFNWIKYNSSYNGIAIVKDANVDTGLVNSPVTLNFDANVTIDGLNSATLIMNEAVTLGSNFTIKNLDITFKNLISVISGASNILFENCNITISNELSPTIPVNNIIFDIVNGSNIKFSNCNINVAYTQPATSGALFRLNNVSNFKVDESLIDVSFNAPANAGYVPGTMFILKNSSGAKFTNSTFEGNFSQFIRNTSSNNLLVKDSYVSSSYNPFTQATGDIFDSTSDKINIDDGLPAVTYDNTNLVNTGRAYIYAKIDNLLENIIIDNVNFSCSQISFGADISRRFSFINFEMSSNTSVLSNVLVNNCKFNNTVQDYSVEDLRPIIAIINSSPIVATNQQQPLLKNINIINNFCNRNQSIIFTSKLGSNDKMVYPGLVTQNCFIKNNTCGSIGYWVAKSSKVISLVPNETSFLPSVNSFSDKDSQLVIEENNCHLINTVDHTGSYFVVSKFVGTDTENMCDYASGKVFIKNNICNWIHVGVSHEEESALIIENNCLSAYDENYLSNYNDAPTSSTWALAYSYGYAIVIGSNKVTTSIDAPAQGRDSACIINNNSTSSGYWAQANYSKIIYRYRYGYILCTASNIISNNIFKGIGENGTNNAYELVSVAGFNNIIKNNKIYRNNYSIQNYINYSTIYDTTVNEDAVTSYGIITDNFFDSPYISGSLDENVISVPNNWITERNINQTSYILIPLTSGLYANTNGFIDVGATPNYVSEDYWVKAANSAHVDTSETQKSLVLRIISNTNSADTRNLTFQEMLNKWLPNNVKIIQLQIGARSFGNDLSSSFANQYGIILNITKYTSNTMLPSSTSSGTNLNSYVYLNQFNNVVASDTKVSNGSTNPFAKITAAQLNATPAANTVIGTINLESIDVTTGGPGTTNVVKDYTINYNYPLTVSVDVRLLKKDGSALTVLISPICIKYRW